MESCPNGRRFTRFRNGNFLWPKQVTHPRAAYWGANVKQGKMIVAVWDRLSPILPSAAMPSLAWAPAKRRPDETRHRPSTGRVARALAQVSGQDRFDRRRFDAEGD